MRIVEKPDETLDLSGVPCPQNTARALLTLEWMDPGEILEVTVDDGEPKENVPPGLEAEGHTIETDKNGKPKKVKDWEGKLVGV